MQVKLVIIPLMAAVVIVWQLDLQLSMQLVPITTKVNVMSLNPAHGKVYFMW